MTTALIAGPGVAAARALALNRRGNPAVIGIGFQFESDREQLAGVPASSPDERDGQTVELISNQPVASRRQVSLRSAYSVETIHGAVSSCACVCRSEPTRCLT
jgi:hypothetical protein